MTRAFDNVSRFARNTSAQLAEQVEDFREAAEDTVEKVTAKKPDPYEIAVTDYNAAFTLMNDTGLSLLRQRERSADLLDLVEFLVNSIAHTPKSFERDFVEIDVERARFMEVLEFARKDIDAARASATGAGAGFAAGAAVATLAPTAAMWAATTFGAASTGTAISTLTGAAASNAALAWLGGGALAAGGGGAAGGTAILALAGPIGWTVAGATLLVSIALFTKTRLDNKEAKESALIGVKQNSSGVRRLYARIENLLDQTMSLRQQLLEDYKDASALFGSDFRSLGSESQSQLGALVNNAKAAASLLGRTVEQDPAGV